MHSREHPLGQLSLVALNSLFFLRSLFLRPGPWDAPREQHTKNQENGKCYLSGMHVKEFFPRTGGRTAAAGTTNALIV